MVSPGSRPQVVLLGAVAALLVLTSLSGCTSPAPPAPGVAPAFVLKWGQYGHGAGDFDYLTGVATDLAGNVYVTDTANDRVEKFNAAGVFLLQWGTYGSGNGQFKRPMAIATDSVGDVYVTDALNYRVEKFTGNGTFLAAWGSYGGGSGQFRYSRGIAVDHLGNVFVSDAVNDNVQKFTSSGTYLTGWVAQGSGNGQFSYPRGVAVDALGFVYVADYGNARVQKFDGNGAFIAKWGSYGTGPGQFKGPYGIAVDSAGSVYVSDVHNDRIQKFTASGGFLTKWGTHGSANGQIDEPYGVAVDTLHNVYVVDGENSRIDKFGFPLSDTILVQAVLDGLPWSGPVGFTLVGPQTMTGSAAPQTSAAAPPGSYSVVYNSGGPPGATYLGSTPAASQILALGGTTSFVLRFQTPTTIVVNATLNGAPWTGPLAFDTSGWISFYPYLNSPVYAAATVPHTFQNVATADVFFDPVSSAVGPGGVYTLHYYSGGPPGAVLTGITPGPSQLIIQHQTKSFTMDFWTPGLSANTIVVDATLDGAPWSGPVGFGLQGLTSTSPFTTTPIYSGATAPQTFAGLLPGTMPFTDPNGAPGVGSLYSIGYLSGGPPGAIFTGVTPSAGQFLPVNGGARFTLDFMTRHGEVGAIDVTATLDGSPWSGTVSYTVNGPQPITGTAAPLSVANQVIGTYSLAYNSGGPPGATLSGIVPAAPQALTTGSSIAFLLEFRTNKADTGTIVVNATLAGAGGSSPWTGPVNFTISGPQALSGSSVGFSSSNAPPGAYSLNYNSGGPPGATLTSITPSTTQTLAAGGVITFTLGFS